MSLPRRWRERTVLLRGTRHQAEKGVSKSEKKPLRRDVIRHMKKGPTIGKRQRRVGTGGVAELHTPQEIPLAGGGGEFATERSPRPKGKKPRRGSLQRKTSSCKAEPRSRRGKGKPPKKERRKKKGEKAINRRGRGTKGSYLKQHSKQEREESL